MPAASSILTDRVSLRLRSFDRLYLNLYLPLLQSSGQVAHFLRDVRGNFLPSPALFGAMTRDFVAGIERYAAAQGLEPIRFARGERKEERIAPLFAAAERDGRTGVVAIGIAQERANSWWGHPGASGGFDFARRTVSVNHYYCYLLDPEWGPAFIKFSSYAPFGGRVWLNGHSWLKRQLAARGVGCSELDNGLLSVADPELAQRLADGLGEAQIRAFLGRWLPALPLPLTPADQEAGYRYEASLFQVELAETLVFARPRDGRAWFEAAIRAHLDLGRPDQVSLVFGRRVTRATPGRFATRVLTSGVDPSIQLHYRRSLAKAYFKLGRALRVETTINDTHDLGLGRLLRNLAELRRKMQQINARLLVALDATVVPLVPAAAVEAICLPTRTGGVPAPALRFADPRVMALFGALCSFALLPNGFSSATLRPLVAALLGAPAEPYSARRMSYDLRRLVRKSIIARLPGTHRYVLTNDGRRLALFFTGTYRRITLPGLGQLERASLPSPDPGVPPPLARAWRSFNTQLNRFVDAHRLAA